MRALRMVTLLAPAGLSFSMTAAAMNLAETIDFQIAPQPLSTALLEFSRQAKVQIIVSPALADYNSAGVSGPHSIGQGVVALLNGTPLVYRVINATSITVENGDASQQPPTSKEAVTRKSAKPAAEPASPAQSTGPDTLGPKLEEIVVTATRHEESLSKVPISMTAFSQENMDIKGVRDFLDIARFTPGVTIDTTGTNAISIRGIGSTGGAGTTGIYIDDTPIQMRALGSNPDDTLPKTFDMERVEVLRGPQGTLFGAGSEGGTVRYIMTQPSLTQFSDYVRSELSYTQGGAPSYEIGAAAGGPIVTDALGFRVSAWFRNDGGWIDRIDPTNLQTVARNANSDQTTAVRAALAWAPSSAVKVTPSFYLQYRQRNDVESYWPIYSNPDQNRFVNGNPTGLYEPDKYTLSALAISADLGPMQLLNNSSYFRRRDSSGYDGTTSFWDYVQTLGWLPGAGGNAEGSDPYAGSLPCAPQGFTCYPLYDGNGLHLPAALANYRAPVSVANNQDVVTQELRLQSTDPNARVVWTVGGFFSLGRTYSLEAESGAGLDQAFEYLYGDTAADIFGSPTNPDGSTYLPRGDAYFLQAVGHDRQLAGFGEAVWGLTDQLKLTTGLRYSKTSFDFNSYSDGPLQGGPYYASGSQTETPLTKRLGLSFQADPNNLFYATFSTGFRVGGANQSIPYNICRHDFKQFGLPGAPPSYNSDTVKSYEIGSKNSFGDRVKIAASVYYIQWNGIQQTVELPDCGLDYIANLGAAVSKGGDLQADFAVTEHLSLESTVGYTDAYYTQTSFPGSRPTTALSVKGDAITGESGDAPAPWSITLGAEYNFRAFGHPSFVRLDAEHSTRNTRPTSNLDPNTVQYEDCTQPSGTVGPCARIPPSTTFMSLRLGSNFRGWQVSAFVDNLLDAHPITNYGPDGPDTSGPQPAPTVLYRYFTFRPRTFGITLTHRLSPGGSRQSDTED